MADSVRLVFGGKRVAFSRNLHFTARDPRGTKQTDEEKDYLVVTVEPGDQELMIDYASALQLASALTGGVAQHVAELGTAPVNWDLQRRMVEARERADELARDNSKLRAELDERDIELAEVRGLYDELRAEIEE